MPGTPISSTASAQQSSRAYENLSFLFTFFPHDNRILKLAGGGLFSTYFLPSLFFRASYTAIPLILGFELCFSGHGVRGFVRICWVFFLSSSQPGGFFPPRSSSYHVHGVSTLVFEFWIFTFFCVVRGDMILR